MYALLARATAFSSESRVDSEPEQVSRDPSVASTMTGCARGGPWPNAQIHQHPFDIARGSAAEHALRIDREVNAGGNAWEHLHRHVGRAVQRTLHC